MSKKIKGIDDLQHDPNNANKGNERGRKAVDDSLTKYGAGRSIVVDQNGVVIGGNKTLDAAKAAGIDIEIIKTKGDKLVVVQREDLDLLKDHKARKLAYADNRAGELGLDWDLDQIKADLDAGMILDDLFSEEEIKGMTDFADEGILPDLASEPEGFKTLTFRLTDEQAETVELAVSECKTKDDPVNPNKNGNALYAICCEFLHG